MKPHFASSAWKYVCFFKYFTKPFATLVYSNFPICFFVSNVSERNENIFLFSVLLLSFHFIISSSSSLHWWQFVVVVCLSCVRTFVLVWFFCFHLFASIMNRNNYKVFCLYQAIFYFSSSSCMCSAGMLMMYSLSPFSTMDFFLFLFLQITSRKRWIEKCLFAQSIRLKQTAYDNE